MIGSFGMGSTLISSDALTLPGNSNLVSKVLSSDAGREEVEANLRSARSSVHELISTHRHIVEALRDALLARDELVGEEITDVIDAARAAESTDPLAAVGPTGG